MARTPSLDRGEAELMLGARGALNVNIDNRSLVRKWLVSCGVPASVVGGLTMSALAGAYNDATDATLNTLATAPAETKPAAAPVVSTPAPANNHQAIAAAIAAALASMPQQGIDADMVRQIIRQELPDLIPNVKVEITEGEFSRVLPDSPRHKAFAKALAIAGQNIPLALVGPAGSGKTTACEQIAEALELPFYMLGAVTGAHEFLGYVDAHGKYQTTPFRHAFEHGGLFLGDEFDGSDPAAPLVINSALANGHMAFPDSPTPVKKHPSFRMVIACNTYGMGADRVYVGRNQLDGATLDRFAFLDWGYDEKLERLFSSNESWVDRVQALRRGAAKEKARVIISPRATINGAKLLAAGLTRDEVETLTIWKNVDADLRRRIETAAA
jgi:cobaltochelatase CobS